MYAHNHGNPHILITLNALSISQTKRKKCRKIRRNLSWSNLLKCEIENTISTMNGGSTPKVLARKHFSVRKPSKLFSKPYLS
jgi:hypothetical protein